MEVGAEEVARRALTAFLERLGWDIPPPEGTALVFASAEKEDVANGFSKEWSDMCVCLCLPPFFIGVGTQKKYEGSMGKRERQSLEAHTFLVYTRDAVRSVLEVSPAQPRNPLPPRLVQASRLLPRLPLARQVLLLPWHRPSASLPGRGRVHFLRLQAGGVRQARVRRVRVKKRDARASTHRSRHGDPLPSIPFLPFFRHPVDIRTMCCSAMRQLANDVHASYATPVLSYRA